MSKAIVVTGASSGIGAALARQLASRGDRVVIAARRKELLDALASELGSNAHALVADVTKRSDVERLRDRAIAALGGVDVWVNNAGRGLSKRALDLTDAELDEMMLVNVKSVLYGMQAIVPHFIERDHGQIINVSSFLSRVPMAPIRAGYSAAKAALNSLTANVRMDLAAAHPGIAVTLVMPGLVSTEFAEHAIHGTPPIRPGAAPPGVQTAEQVADVIVRTIDHPAAEVYTNPAHAGVARRYFEDVGLFEAGLRS
jgi:short-subunit dehydrogenase